MKKWAYVRILTDLSGLEMELDDQCVKADARCEFQRLIARLFESSLAECRNETVIGYGVG
jgi:hypothetical protein